MTKLSSRDKQILALLGIIILATIYYQFVYTPQSNRLSELNQQKIDYENRISDMQIKISKMAELEKNLEEEKKLISPIVEKYFSNMHQENLILLINELGRKSSLDIKNLQFSEMENFGFEVSNIESKLNSAENSETTGEGETQPQENAETPPAEASEQNDYSNLEMTNVEVSFVGTYDELAKLLKIIDENEQNIVSNKLSIAKREDASEDQYTLYREGKDSRNYIEGNLNLQFFRVKSLEEYMPKIQETMLDTNPIPKSKQISPIIEYSWAKPKEQTNVVYSQQTTSQAIRDSYEYIKNIEDYAQTKNFVEYKRPVEITRFDSLNGFDIYKEDGGNSITISMDGVEDINYKVIRADLEFSKDTELGKKVFIDMKEKQIKLSEKPDSMTLNIYSPKSSGYELGLVLRDSEGKQVILPFSQKISFMGWKNLELKVDSVKFPAYIDAIYFSRISDENDVNGSIYVESLHANYIQVK